MTAKQKPKTIQEVLNYIQVNLNAPKNQYNSFGGYKYRSCEDILSALKPLLKETGAILTIEDTLEQIGGRYYIKATAVLRFGDASISTSAYAREPESKKGMDEAQITGATSSYARKYALNGLFAIDDTKDPDFLNTHGKEEVVKKQTQPKQPQKKEPVKQEPEGAKQEPEEIPEKRKAKLRQQIFTVLDKHGRDQFAFRKFLESKYGTDSTKDLTEKQLEALIKGIDEGKWADEF